MTVEAMMCVEFRQPRLRGSKFSPSPARSVGEGARRADEGSLFKLNQYVRFILLQKSSSGVQADRKSPHPAFGHPLPSLRDGRGGSLRGQTDLRQFSPDSPAPLWGGS